MRQVLVIGLVVVGIYGGWLGARRRRARRPAMAGTELLRRAGATSDPPQRDRLAGIAADGGACTAVYRPGGPACRILIDAEIGRERWLR